MNILIISEAWGLVRKTIQTHVVVEMLLHVLPAAVENVGVNGYVSEHGIDHEPNVTNLQISFFYSKEKNFFREGSFGSNRKKIWKKLKSYETIFRQIIKNNKNCRMTKWWKVRDSDWKLNLFILGAVRLWHFQQPHSMNQNKSNSRNVFNFRSPPGFSIQQPTVLILCWVVHKKRHKQMINNNDL